MIRPNERKGGAGHVQETRGQSNGMSNACLPGKDRERGIWLYACAPPERAVPVTAASPHDVCPGAERKPPVFVYPKEIKEMMRRENHESV